MGGQRTCSVKGTDGTVARRAVGGAPLGVCAHAIGLSAHKSQRKCRTRPSPPNWSCDRGRRHSYRRRRHRGSVLGIRSHRQEGSHGHCCTRSWQPTPRRRRPSSYGVGMAGSYPSLSVARAGVPSWSRSRLGSRCLCRPSTTAQAGMAPRLSGDSGYRRWACLRTRHARPGVRSNRCQRRRKLQHRRRAAPARPRSRRTPEELRDNRRRSCGP